MKWIYNVVCIGAGGTGTFFLKEFARFMAAYQLKDFDKLINLSIIDGDSVETKNLERQAYLEEDVNENKAVTIAAAIKECFGLKHVIAYPIYIDTVQQLDEIYMRRHDDNKKLLHHNDFIDIDVLIGCSDNHRARQVMHYFFMKHKKMVIYYDAANEYSNGEVVFAGRYEGKLLGRPRAYYFKNVLEDKSPRASEASCGAMNASAPQHLVTNMMAGNLLLSKLIKLITENELDFGIVLFDALKMYVSYYPDKEAEEITGGEKVEGDGPAGRETA